MSFTDDDPLAVLPVTAAAATAAFARAGDTTRAAEERRRELAVVKNALATAGQLLQRSEAVVARLSVELDEREHQVLAVRCPGTTSVCTRCLGAPLTRSGGIGVCFNCALVRELPPGEFHCGEPVSVTLQAAGATPRSFCRSHAAAALRDDDHLAVVFASRPDRALLAEASQRSAVVRANALPRAHRGRDA